eukprot:COSAG02_NODE_610_length_19566_cov_39.049622_14_plen_2310_part_01
MDSDGTDPCTSQDANAICYDGVNSFQCDCSNGYSGDTCTDVVDPCTTNENECSEHARCEHIGDRQIACICHIGYSGNGFGDNCTDVDECLSEPCQNGGTCVDRLNAYQCNCAPGWKSEMCEEDINECESSPCANDGDCLNPVDTPDTWLCACRAGFMDDTSPGVDIGCSIDIDECSSSPCEGANATVVHQCVEGDDSYSCLCAPGWAGENCEEDFDECASGPCFNRAQCNQDIGVDAFSCTCADGWQGELCERDIDECHTRTRSFQNGVYTEDTLDHGGCDELVVCINLPGTWQCGSCPIRNETKVRTVPSGFIDHYSLRTEFSLRSEASPWDAAQEFCGRFGRQLVSIVTAEDKVELLGLIDGLSGRAWTGLRRVPGSDGSACGQNISASSACWYWTDPAATANALPNGVAFQEVGLGDCVSITSTGILLAEDCEASVPAYVCGAHPGPAPRGGFNTCVDIDECGIDNGGCDNLALCTNDWGSYSCGLCPSMYTNEIPALATALDYIPYTGDGNVGCVDVNECAASRGACDGNVPCTNTNGSFYCGTCPLSDIYDDENAPAGTVDRFTPFVGNGTIECVDVDECRYDNGGCDMLTTCTNSFGSFQCGECPTEYPGPIPAHHFSLPYTGDGTTGCVDVDECNLGAPHRRNGGCHELTTCINLEGSFTCSPCPDGYTGNGITGCVDINECHLDDQFGSLMKFYERSFSTLADATMRLNTLTGDHVASEVCSSARQAALTDLLPDQEYEGACDDMSVCFNRPGTFECGQCPDGYTGNAYEHTVYPSGTFVVGSGCADIDECASSPCKNGAACTDSGIAARAGTRITRPGDDTIAADRYRCTCTSGYANGECGYSFIDEYADRCDIFDSRANPDYGGNCDIDVNECDSSPCDNQGTCTDSSNGLDSGIPTNAYTCTCEPGFSNGKCDYEFIDEVRGQCSHALGGSCGVDVDECISQPCRNAAVCDDSASDGEVSPDAFRCSCQEGFANGMCVQHGRSWNSLSEYNDRCNVPEGGTCDQDIIECESNPCQNEASCTESSTDSQMIRVNPRPLLSIDGNDKRIFRTEDVGLHLATAGEEATFSVKAASADGSEVSVDTSALHVTLSHRERAGVVVSGALAPVPGELKQQASYVAITSGQYDLLIARRGVIKYSGSVNVVAGAISADETTASGSGWISANSGVPAEFIITARDAYGNKRTDSIRAFTYRDARYTMACIEVGNCGTVDDLIGTELSRLQIQDFDWTFRVDIVTCGTSCSADECAGGETVSSTVSWNAGSSGYPVEYTATTANQYYHIAVYLEKWDSNHESKIEETPIGSPSTCIFASVSGTSQPYTFTDTEQEFTAGGAEIFLIQGNGQPAATSFGVTFINTETQQTLLTTIVPDNAGNFVVPVNPEQAGVYTVYAVSSTGVSVDGSGATVITVAPGSFSAATSEITGAGASSAAVGELSTFIIIGRDPYGNQVRSGGPELTVSAVGANVTGADPGSLPSVTNNGDGSYTGSYVVRTAISIEPYDNFWVRDDNILTHVRPDDPFQLLIQEVDTLEHIGVDPARSPLTVYPAAVPDYQYTCSCVDGFANGMCYYNFIGEYESECSVTANGNCNIDVDECASNPCEEPGTLQCLDYVSKWACQCQPGWKSTSTDDSQPDEDTVAGGISRAEHVLNGTGWYEPQHGTQIHDGVAVSLWNSSTHFHGPCDISIDPCSAAEMHDCDDVHKSACEHVGPGLHTCLCRIGWQGNGTHCYDIDECQSSPCENGGVCTESNCDDPNAAESVKAACRRHAQDFTQNDPMIPMDRYKCDCAAGFANGMCASGWDQKSDIYTAEYQSDCTVELGGHCDIDIDECVSLPCDNAATCTDSRATTTWNNITVSFDAYSCECRAGFADGACSYDFIAEYDVACAVTESSVGGTRPLDRTEFEEVALAGNCIIDVNECDSNPCENGATCTDSTMQTECFVNEDGAWLCHSTERSVTTTFYCGDTIYDSDGITVLACNSTQSLLGHQYHYVPGWTTDDGELNSRHIQYPDNTTLFGERSDELSPGLFYGVGVSLEQCSNAADAGIDAGCDAFEYGDGMCRLYSSLDGSTAQKASGETMYYRDDTVRGCTDPKAYNYNHFAEQSDGTCVYPKVQVHEYSCACAPGFANGQCRAYDFISLYRTQCEVETSSSTELSGNCDVDVNECDSSPCQNNATCSDSTTDSTVSVHAYRCACTPGFANGVCEYDGDARSREDPPYGFIVEYEDECSVQESEDNPTQIYNNDGTNPDPLRQYYDDRTIVDHVSGTVMSAGNCDIDVDECDSSPCQNGATCTESSVEASVSFHAYQ